MLQKLTQMRQKKGFTLVELIVVIAILAILAAIAIPAFLNVLGTARTNANAVQSKNIATLVSFEVGQGHLVLGTSDITGTTGYTCANKAGVIAYLVGQHLLNSTPVGASGGAFTVDVNASVVSVSVDGQTFIDGSLQP
jgi:type IV pilus assembly protein PilA